MLLKINNDSKKYYYWIIVVFTFVLYSNSINNEYSLDDNIVIDKKDAIVEKGFKAIPKILKSRYATDAEQSYGYRPVTTISFAIEKQFFNKLPSFQTKEQKERKDKMTQANISHFINVLIYALTCLLLFQLLANLFDSYHIILSFVITVLFMIHPIHTEVVANIKCRDELLMFLFMVLTIKHYLSFEITRKYKYLFFAVLFALLCILSKKNGFALLGVLPVILYFKRCNWKRILLLLLSFAVVFVVFKLIKKGIVSKESIREFQYFENPLLLEGSTFMDRITVGLYSSLFYLKMLVFPYKMSFYYGYNAIPMATWKFWEVWVALLIYVPLGIYGVIQFLKRKVIGLGIILWLGVMLSVINILLPMVGIVADRFSYTFSLGFCIVVGYLLLIVFKVDLKKDQLNLDLPKTFLGVMTFIIVVYSGRTIARNPDWHDYLHTYTVDVDNVPSSAKAHSLIASTLHSKVANNRTNPKNKEYVDDIIYHYHEAIKIDSTYLTCYCNLGSAYIDFLNDYNKGVYYSGIAVQMDKDYLEANYNLATAYDRLNQPDSAYKYYLRSIDINPNTLANYGAYNELLKKYGMVDKGITALLEIAKETDSPKYIYLNIANLYSLDNTKVGKSVEYFEKAFASDPTDMMICSHLIGLFQKFGDVQKANYYRSLYIKP